MGNTQWEYKIFTNLKEAIEYKHEYTYFTDEELTEELNALGQEGWELVSLQTFIGNGFTGKNLKFFLKRQIQSVSCE